MNAQRKVPRTCIFCGVEFRGQKKNFEHVISRWLVEHADLAKRTMPVALQGRQFDAAMNRIGAHSCAKCNDESSGLESAAKHAYGKILNGDDLFEWDIQVLLDWLDKVRTGLWLWLVAVGRDEFKFRPKFTINSRVATKDRLLAIVKYRPEQRMTGLGLQGVNPIFARMPSAVGLLINNVQLLSISTDLFVLRHMRPIEVRRAIRGGAERDHYEVVAADTPGERLRLLGTPTIFGQSIMLEELAHELRIPNMRKSSRHVSLLETPVMRMDTNLQSTDGPLGCVEYNAVTPDAGVPLMEINLSLATDYMLRDFLKADFAKFTPALQLQSVHQIWNGYLATERANRAALANRYRRATGLFLPVL